MLGDGRRKTLKTLREKPSLQPVENPTSVDELKEAVREVSVEGYMGVETEIIQRIDRIHASLPDEAKSAYIEDKTLLRRINALRNQFGTWKHRAIREKKMPGPSEAGPSKYPTKKLHDRIDSAHKAHEELNEKKQKVKAGAKGARQRALQSIGSSVGERNEQKRESKRETLREELEAGDCVLFIDLPDPHHNLGKVVRVNQKTARIAYADDLEQKRTVDLKPKCLKKVPPDKVNEAKKQMNGESQ